MGLKSYRLFKKKEKKKKNKKRKFGSVRDLVVGGTGALIGIALVDQTADAVSAL